MTNDTLAGAIAARDPGDEPLPEDNLPAPVAAFGPPDRARILQLLGLDPDEDISHAVVAVAERYGLDPMLGEIAVLPKARRPYITAMGYIRVAHDSGQFDGMEIIDGPRRDPVNREWVATIAVYRKDMSHPFIFIGRAGLDDPNGPEMAVTRAERRALRRAFAVSTRLAEEDGDIPAEPLAIPGPDDGASPAVVPVPEQAVPPTQTETIAKDRNLLAAVNAMLREEGIPGTQRTARMKYLSDATGRDVKSSAELTPDEAREMLSRRAEKARDAEPPGAAEPAEEAVPMATGPQRTEIVNRFRARGVRTKTGILGLLSDWAGRGIGGTDQLTEEEAARLIAQMAEEDSHAPDER